MKHGISFAGFGHASSLFLAITFALCVGFDLIFPAHAMYQAWQKLLPGFEWISWRSFFLGLIESYGYGWYITLIWVWEAGGLASISGRRLDGLSN